MRPDTRTNEEVPGRSGPEILAAGQDWMGQWKAAVNTLADAYINDEGASFRAYRGLVYRYIMMRANDPSLASAALERDAADAAEHDKSYYGVLLRMYRGEDVGTELVEAADAASSGAGALSALLVPISQAKQRSVLGAKRSPGLRACG